MFKKIRKMYDDYIDREAEKSVAASQIKIENLMKGPEFLSQLTKTEKAVEVYNKSSKTPEDLVTLLKVINISLNHSMKGLKTESNGSYLTAFTYRLHVDIIRFKMFEKICEIIKNTA